MPAIKKHTLPVKTLLLLCFIFLEMTTGAQTNADTLKQKSFIALPYGSYSVETSWAAGVAANYYLWNSNELNRVSTFALNAAYTLNNQIIIGLYNRYYFGDGYFIYGRAIFEKYPDYFFGIGNNNPDSSKELFVPLRYHINFEPQKFITETQMLGVSLQTRRESILEYTEGMELENQLIPGSEPYYLYSIGGIYAIDSRDNNYYPEKGIYWKNAVNYFIPVLGSKYHYADIKSDFRYYKKLGDKLIIANQFVVQYIAGVAPFQMTPTFGGLDKMRGYRNGQYRDNLFVMEQLEARFPIYKRVLGAVFVGAGNVWEDPSKMNFSGIKVAVGAGLRYRVNDAKINLRGDGAVTRNGNLGYYLTSSEAF